MFLLQEEEQLGGWQVPPIWFEEEIAWGLRKRSQSRGNHKLESTTVRCVQVPREAPAAQNFPGPGGLHHRAWKVDVFIPSPLCDQFNKQQQPLARRLHEWQRQGLCPGTWRQVCGQVGTILLPGPCKSKRSFADYSHLNVNCFSRIYTQAHDTTVKSFWLSWFWGGWGKGRGEKRAMGEREEEEEAGVSLVLSTFSSLLSTRDLPSMSQADGLDQPLSPRQPRTP